MGIQKTSKATINERDTISKKGGKTTAGSKDT